MEQGDVTPTTSLATKPALGNCTRSALLLVHDERQMMDPPSKKKAIDEHVQASRGGVSILWGRYTVCRQLKIVGWKEDP